MTDMRNAGLVTAISKSWTAIRAAAPDVQGVHLSLGPMADRRTGRLAHYAQRGDVAELLVSYRIQNDPAYDGARLMGVLVHEACHSISHTRQIKSTTSHGLWHNALFADVAAEHGLYLNGRDANRGADTLNQFAAKHYKTQIAGLDKALAALRTGGSDG